MTVFFRADASANIGSGHVMRCMTLADQVLAMGQKTRFLCRSLPRSLLDTLATKGHSVSLLPRRAPTNVPGRLAHSDWLQVSQAQDAEDCRAAIGTEYAEWIVVDHYALDAEWEQAVRSQSHGLAVIDDLADRHHDCDILLDQNLGRKAAAYQGLVPDHCQLLIGPEHALLRPEFALARQISLERRAGQGIRHLLITMGGFDQDDVTGKVLHALGNCALPSDAKISVVMGSQAPWLASVQAQAERMKVATDVLVDVKDMASLMAASDLAFGAAGGTAWERCCLGLPTIMFVLADNQEGGATALAEEGCAVLIAADGDLTADIQAALADLSRPERLVEMQAACIRVTDGAGASRLAKNMLDSVGHHASNLRHMTMADLPLVLSWRNHTDIRKFMLTQDEIELEAHSAWFEKMAKDPTRHLMIYENGQRPLGFMNLKVDTSGNVADWGFYAAPGAAKGTGRKMGEAAIAYGFETLGLNKICGQVLDFNEASLRFHKALGFAEEGTLREQARINNTYHALVCFGLLKREWLQSKLRVN